MLPPLLGLALADEPAEREPLIYGPAPHPVSVQYGVRFQELLEETMGGPTASPVFGPTVAEADVYWRFAAWDPDLMILPDDAPARWRDTALAGSVLAFSKLIDEMIADAPQIAFYRTAIDSVLNPNIQVSSRRRGEGLSVRHQTGGRTAQRVQRQEGLDPSGALGARPPQLGAGLDWDLRDPDAPKRDPLLSYGAWLSVANLGISSLRLDADFRKETWSTSARQRITREVSLYGNARSADHSFLPERLAGGLMWTLPAQGSWSLRLERSLQLSTATSTWMLTLRGEGHTPIPARMGRQLGEGGLCLPPLPDRSPNETGPPLEGAGGPVDAWRGCDRH